MNKIIQTLLSLIGQDKFSKSLRIGRLVAAEILQYGIPLGEAIAQYTTNTVDDKILAGLKTALQSFLSESGADVIVYDKVLNKDASVSIATGIAAVVGRYHYQANGGGSNIQTFIAATPIDYNKENIKV